MNRVYVNEESVAVGMKSVPGTLYVTEEDDVLISLRNDKGESRLYSLSDGTREVDRPGHSFIRKLLPGAEVRLVVK